MNFTLTDIENYKTYFEALADSSVHLDGFLFGDVKVGQNDAHSWQGLKLWAWPADRSRLNDLRFDNYYLGREATIWIGGPCSSEKWEDEDTFYKNVENIMKKVVSKLIYDKQNADLAIDFNGGQINRADMKLSSTNLIGCEYIFTILDPDGFEYNEADWE
jgi:hypothetical protein